MDELNQHGRGWRRARACANGGATCVEVAFGDGVIYVRNSRAQAGLVLTFSAEEWQTFLDGVRHREFDLPET